MDGRDTPAPLWTRRDWRVYHHRRSVRISVADDFVALARRVAREPIGDVRWACRVLLKAAVTYSEAGMSRRGQVAWRLAQWIHRFAPPGSPTVLISERELRDITNLTAQSVRHLVKTGRIPHVVIGDRTWFVRDVVEAWLDARRRPRGRQEGGR
jgi:hypothetical protein